MSSRGVQPRGDLNPHRVILSAAKNLTSYSPLRLPHPSAEGCGNDRKKGFNDDGKYQSIYRDVELYPGWHFNVGILEIVVIQRSLGNT